jgi:hypothetical protein
VGTTVGGLVYPEHGDAPAGFQQVKALADSADPHIVRWFTNAADRSSRNPTPQDGEISYLADVDRHEGRQNGAWVRFTTAADLTLLTSPPACHLYRAAAMSLNGTTTPVPVVWTESARDTGGMFTDNSSRVTIPTSGMYHVIANPGFGNYVALKLLSVRKNSGGVASGGTELFVAQYETSGGASVPPVLAVFEEPFTGGDYYEVFVSQNGGTVQAGGLVGGQSRTFTQARRVSS